MGLANAGADTSNAIKQAAEFGAGRGGQKLAGLLIFINDINTLGLEAAQGMLLTNAFYWDRNEESRAWAQRYFQRMNRMPNMAQAGIYSATTHYLKAIEAAGTDETQAVMAKMRSTPINDFFVKNGTIRDDGRMVHDMYLYEVKKPAESKGAWDYYKLVATIPADQAFQPLSELQMPAGEKDTVGARPLRSRQTSLGRLRGLLAHERLCHFAQPHPLHFGAIRAVNDGKLLDHDNPLRDLEPRQLLETPRPQSGLAQYGSRQRLDECDGHRIALPARGRHHLDACDAGLSLNNRLDLLWTDQEPAKPHGIAKPRLIHKSRIVQPCEITGPEHAVGVDRALGCRRIFQVLHKARRRIDPQFTRGAGRQRAAGFGIAHLKARLFAHRHAAAEQTVLAFGDRERGLHLGTAVEPMWSQPRRLRRRNRRCCRGVERRESRETYSNRTGAHWTLPRSSKHVVATDHMGDAMLPDQLRRGLAVKLREADDVRAAGNRGHRCGIAERAAQRDRAKQCRIRRVQPDVASYVGGVSCDGLLIMQNQLRPAGGAGSGESEARHIAPRLIYSSIGRRAIERPYRQSGELVNTQTKWQPEHATNRSTILSRQRCKNRREIDRREVPLRHDSAGAPTGAADLPTSAERNRVLM